MKVTNKLASKIIFSLGLIIASTFFLASGPRTVAAVINLPDPWRQITSLTESQRMQIQQILASYESKLEIEKSRIVAGRTQIHQQNGTTNLLKIDIALWTQQALRLNGLLKRREVMMVLTPNQRQEANELWSNIEQAADVVDFQPFEVKQKNALWCWAASIAMVLNYGGVDWDQERVAQEIKGTSDAWERATAAEIEAGLKQSHISQNPRRNWAASCRYTHGTQDPGRMIFSLEFGRPMLAALEDVHVVVIHKVVFTENIDSGQRKILKVTFYDPLQHEDKTLRWDEAQKVVTDVWYPLVDQFANDRF